MTRQLSIFIIGAFFAVICILLLVKSIRRDNAASLDNFGDTEPATGRSLMRRLLRLFDGAKARVSLPPVKREAGDAPLAPHLALGRRGERLAASHLRRAGYRLVASNFKLNVGRNLRGAVVQAEIDLVGYDGATLCFVEVKTRASERFAAPEANVDLRKQRQVTRAARAYRRLFGVTRAPHRYDVVSVVIPAPSEDERARPPRVELLRNFWTEEKFRKRRWRA